MLVSNDRTDERSLWEEVLLACPDCGASFDRYDSRGIEYEDGDIARGIISCDECPFRARETWGLVETRRSPRGGDDV